MNVFQLKLSFEKFNIIIIIIIIIIITHTLDVSIKLIAIYQEFILYKILELKSNCKFLGVQTNDL